MKKVLKSFLLIINYKTLIITALSVLSTYICYRLGFTAKFPDMLVGVAIVFPVVFSIGSAYNRRESALQRFSDFKGHALENERKIYANFSRLSGITNAMREHGVQTSETSRVNQYVSKMIIAFDNLQVVHTYRTPVTLRAYSKVFIYIFPIIYGPYFASTFNDFSANLEYVMPVLYSFILVSLDNIQDHLEHPFDEIGEDDIHIDENSITSYME